MNLLLSQFSRMRTTNLLLVVFVGEHLLLVFVGEYFMSAKQATGIWPTGMIQKMLVDESKDYVADWG